MPSCGRSWLYSCRNRSKLCCCCRWFAAGGRAVSAFRVRCIRSWRPFCSGWAADLAGLIHDVAVTEALKDAETVAAELEELGEL